MRLYTFIALLFTTANGQYDGDSEFNELTTIRGAGATTAEDLFKVWSAYYESSRSAFVNVRVEYESRGSSLGKSMLEDGEVMFAVSDSALTDLERNSSNLRQIPCFAWSLVLAYNVPGLIELTLTREQVVGIYNGSITNWNDTSFHAHNNPNSLPNATIIPVARFESSGSTNVFTRALSSFDSNWKQEYGIFSDRFGWKTLIKTFGQRTTGLADVLTNTFFSIGYLITSGATEVDLNYADMINKAGYKVTSSNKMLNDIIEARKTNLKVDQIQETLTDYDLPNAYPISALSYIFVNTSVRAEDCGSNVEFYRFLDWTINSKLAWRSANSVDMVLVGNFISKATYSNVIQKMTCNGLSLDRLAKAQIYEEEESLKTWKKPLMVSIPLVFVCFVVIVAYASYQKYLYSKMIDNNSWKINFFDIDLKPKTDLSRNQGKCETKQTQLSKSILDYDSLSAYCHSHQLGSYEGTLVTLGNSLINKEPNSKWTHKASKILFDLKRISHSHLVSFVGLASSPTAELVFVEEYCSRGNIIKLLTDSKYKMTSSICFALCRDICNAMSFLHERDIVVGLLQPSSCLIDSRWTVKICGWEAFRIFKALFYENWKPLARLTSRISCTKNIISELKAKIESTCERERIQYFNIWLAPEIISSNYHQEPNKSTDVYSFGVIMLAIFCKYFQKHGSLKFSHQTDASVLEKLASMNLEKSCENVPEKICNLIILCCNAEPNQRPKFESLISTLRSCDNNPNFNVLDHIMDHYEHVSEENGTEAIHCDAACVEVSV